MARDDRPLPPAPEPPPPSLRERSGGGTAAIIAAAVLLVVPITASQEGFVRHAAPDPAHIPTYCYGETQNVDPSRIYTKGECMELLRQRLGNDYAPKVLRCLPRLADPRRKYVFAALIDASYNAGPAAVCKSPMAAAVAGGRWTAGCKAFVGWYTTATDRKTGVRKELPGLVTRRRDVERPLCLKGAVLTASSSQVSTSSPPSSRPLPPPPASSTPPPATPSLMERIAAFFRRLLGA